MPKKKKMRMSAPPTETPPSRRRSSQFFEGIDFCYRSSASQFVLSDLPDELIRKLSEYLDPPSLVAISYLNIRRLSNQFDTLQSADFSMFNTIGIQDLQAYFNRERVKHIQELNFNNLFFVTPYILTTCAARCKNITKLYVLNCGITFMQIIRILDSCSHLEELYWSIRNEDCHSLQKQKIHTVSESIKKLYLQVGFEGTTFFISEKFLDVCPNTEEFIVNFSPYYATSLPSISATMYFTMQLKFQTEVRSFTILLKCEEETIPTPMRHFILKVSRYRDVGPYELFELVEGHPVPFYFTRHTSLLQFFDESKYLDELPTLPAKSVKSLVMVLKNNIDILNHLNKIKKMTSNALKHLSLHKLSPNVQHRDADVNSPYVHDILRGLVANSCNITVLDLSKLHMRGILPLSSLCNLRKLKVFNVSTCCFIINNTVEEVDYKILDYQKDFEDFIMKCNKVVRFSISDCKAECRSIPMNDILCLVSKWKELKYLTVQNVKALRECQFLIPIADSCSKLKSLEFSGVGLNEVCHFMSNIKYVLNTSKELQFLRINHPGLYPMDPLLWNNLESAQKLQGLCLSSMLTTATENKTVIDGISKLPHLHLCHLLFKQMCGNLSVQIKKVMAAKGVKVPDVKTSIIAFFESFVDCNCKHFPTE